MTGFCAFLQHAKRQTLYSWNFYCSPCQMQLALFINFNEPKCNMKNDLLYNLDIFQCAIV